MPDLARPAKAFHSKVTFDFLRSPTFRRALDATSLAKLQVEADRYKHFSAGGIDRLEFQERAVKDACKKTRGLWCGELWTGAGKSIIAARVALEFLKRGGKVIFICPNRMGIGSVADGIIQKFHRTFEHYKAPYRIGSLDEVSLLDDVHFFTPHAFVRMFKTADALFKKIISESCLLIVDEAHHFPEDPDEDQVIYGKIEKFASRYFICGGKKVVTLTATHGRHDGKPVFKREKPDFQITVNEAVQNGWCPEIHGLPVYLTVKAPKAVMVGTDYYLNFNTKQLLRYLRQVAAVMLEVQGANPSQQFCAFVRTIREARKLQEIWNREAQHLGFKPVALLVGNMSIPERMAIKKAIQNGEYVGYITCDVGSESIDIPKMETVHLIRRTRSINKIVQSIGRVLRNHPEKRRALIVDYHLSERKIIRACQGLELYAKYVKSGAKRLVSGGPLVPIEGTPNADFAGISLGEEKAWIERSLIPGVLQEGSVYGWLTVTRYDDANNVLCRCKCGNEYVARKDRLLNKKSVSCGCYRRETTKLEPGRRFGKLIVKQYTNSLSVRCLCDCGRETVTYKHGLLKGTTKSCGCLAGRVGPLNKGARFGNLTILEDKGYEEVRCLCDCGKRIVTSRAALGKSTRSCGCVKLKLEPTKASGNEIPAGARFGRLEVLEDQKSNYVVCVCDCGNLVSTYRSALRSMGSRSCGCLRFERLNLSKHPAVDFDGKRSVVRNGTRINNLTVVDGTGGSTIVCQCECGSLKKVDKTKFLSGGAKSCGCERSKKLRYYAKFGRLMVLKDEGAHKVKCICRCGKLVTKRRGSLTSGNVKSCGCLVLGDPIKKGRRFGKLVVLQDRGANRVLCLCDCGKKRYFVRGFLKAGQNSSCGCLAGKRLPKFKAGQVFGRWTTIKQVSSRHALCRCVCGNERRVQRKHLFGGNSRSCGCSTQFARFKKGQKFSHVTVVSDTGLGLKGAGKRKIVCRCACGKELEVSAYALKRTKNISCGCARILVRPVKAGGRFNMLKVIEDKGCTRVRCLCDCGSETILSRASLRYGQKSCGCLHTTARRLKPGSCYGEWTIISDLGCREIKARCSCGFIKEDHYRPNLTSGKSKRCSKCGLKKNAERLAARNTGKREAS